MSPALLLQTFVNGLAIGMTYVLIASGFTLIYSIMRILNFAHGELYMLGAFMLYVFLENLHMGYLPSFFLSVIVVGLLGVIIERAFFRPFRGSHEASLIIALGLSLLISGSALLAFGAEDRAVHSVFKGVLTLGRVCLSWERLAVIFISLGIMAGLWAFLQKVKYGMAMRAVAQDADAAALQGINIDNVCSIGFGLSCALAAVAGALMAPIYYFNPFIGGIAIFKALVVVIIGGLGSIPGAVIGGLLLGLVESFGFTFIGGIAEIIGFVFILILLIFRPRGLMGRY